MGIADSAPATQGVLAKERGMQMDSKIMRGFPVRRCSWSCKPIVPIAMTRRMFRWLDSVCLKQVTFKSESGDAKNKYGTTGVVYGI